MNKSPYMRNDRATRIDVKDKLKKKIELKLGEGAREDAAIESRNRRRENKT